MAVASVFSDLAKNTERGLLRTIFSFLDEQTMAGKLELHFAFRKNGDLGCLYMHLITTDSTKRIRFSSDHWRIRTNELENNAIWQLQRSVCCKTIPEVVIGFREFAKRKLREDCMLGLQRREIARFTKHPVGLYFQLHSSPQIYRALAQLKCNV